MARKPESETKPSNLLSKSLKDRLKFANAENSKFYVSKTEAEELRLAICPNLKRAVVQILENVPVVVSDKKRQNQIAQMNKV